MPWVIRALTALGGSASNQEMHDWIAVESGLSDEAIDTPHLDGPRSELEYRLAWARTYLKNVGAVDNSEKGVWTITSSGRSVTEDDITDIKQRVRAVGRERRKRQELTNVEQEEPDNGGGDEKDWKDQLLAVLGEMSPDGFERLCQRVLRESGFTKVEVTGKSGDGGIDGIGILRVNLLSFRVIFQSKRWKGSVGAGVVRDFRGAMVGRADKGLIMSTGSFTADARREATRDGAPAIDLIDGEDFCALLKDNKIGVKVSYVENVEIDEEVFSSI